jgi:Domain of unknown function (DUF4184)
MGHWPLYKLLQYGSGLLGIVGLLLWARQALKQAPVNRQIDPPIERPMGGGAGRAIVYAGIAFTMVLFTVWAILLHASSLDTTATIGVRAVIGAIAGGFVGLVLYAIGFWVATWQTR